MNTSVIVPNHNRDLTALKSSLPQGVEFIEVNLGLERSHQRNIGIAQATEDYLLILDSDQTISYGLIQECEELMAKGYDALYIPERIIAHSWFGRLRAFERMFYTGTPVDVPRFVRREGCPHFDPDLCGPEDADWGNRLPPARTITTRCLFHHDDISFWEYCRKKAYYGRSMARYREKWPGDPCLSLKYRCWTVFTEKGKWKRLVKRPGMALGILFLLFVRGVIYVQSLCCHRNSQYGPPDPPNDRKCQGPELQGC